MDGLQRLFFVLPRSAAVVWPFYQGCHLIANLVGLRRNSHTYGTTRNNFYKNMRYWLSFVMFILLSFMKC